MSQNRGLVVGILLSLWMACLIPYLSHAEKNACSARLDPQSADAHYRTLPDVRMPSTKTVAQVLGLLNSALMPLFLDLSEVVEKLSPKEILAQLVETQKLQPIRTSRYKSNLAIPEGQEHLTSNLIVHSAMGGTTAHEMLEWGVPGWIRQTARRFGLMPENPFASDIKHFSDFLWVVPESAEVAPLGKAHWTFQSMITPVGAYGENFSVVLLRTTQIMVQLANASLKARSREIYLSSPNLLGGESARARQAVEERATPDLLPLSIMVEGIVSLNQAFALMLAEKVEGVDSGRDALEIVINGDSDHHGLITEFTARITMAMVGPMTLTGVYFANALARDEDGYLGLSERLKFYLKDRADRSLKFTGARRICPMALRTCPGEEGTAPISQLQVLAEMYWKIFSIVALKN